MRISGQEFNTELWQRLVATMNETLDKLHLLNEKSQSMDQTAEIRGKIKLVRMILAIKPTN